MPESTLVPDAPASLLFDESTGDAGRAVDRSQTEPVVDPSQRPESDGRGARIVGKRRRSSLGAVAIAVIMIVAATWFSNAQGVTDIAARGAVGVRAEAALSAAAVAQNRVAQATIIQRAVALEVANEDELAAAVSSIEAASKELDSRITQLGGDMSGSSGAVVLLADRFTEALSATLSVVVEGTESGRRGSPARVRSRRRRRRIHRSGK